MWGANFRNIRCEWLEQMVWSSVHQGADFTNIYRSPSPPQPYSFSLPPVSHICICLYLCIRVSTYLHIPLLVYLNTSQFEYAHIFVSENLCTWTFGYPCMPIPASLAIQTLIYLSLPKYPSIYKYLHIIIYTVLYQTMKCSSSGTLCLFLNIKVCKYVKISAYSFVCIKFI